MLHAWDLTPSLRRIARSRWHLFTTCRDLRCTGPGLGTWRLSRLVGRLLMLAVQSCHQVCGEEAVGVCAQNGYGHGDIVLFVVPHMGSLWSALHNCKLSSSRTCICVSVCVCLSLTALTQYYVMFPFTESVTFFGLISYLWHGERVVVALLLCVGLPDGHARAQLGVTRRTSTTPTWIA